MSDVQPPTPTPADPTPAPPVEPTVPAQDQTPAPPAKPETDWKAEARKWETRAKENTAAAKKLAAIEEASKSEAQKQAEALAALQQENEALKLSTLKAQVAALKGVPADLLSGSSQEELEAAADRLLAFKGSTPDPVPDFGAGDRGKSNAVTQVTRTELASMTPQQIEEARIAGRLDDVLAGK